MLVGAYRRDSDTVTMTDGTMHIGAPVASLREIDGWVMSMPLVTGGN